MSTAQPQSATASAPETTVVIRPAKGWIALDLPELWRYRDLLYFLTWRDVKVKYKQTLLGFAWAVIVPFTNMVVFGVVFGRIAGLPSNGLSPYLFYLAALVPWQYFANAVNFSSNSLVGYSHLLTKIYLPRLFIPLGTCLAALVDFGIAFAILLVMMPVFGVVPAWSTLLVPAVMVIAFGTALGTGLALSALNVKYRDIRFVVPFILQVWMYCSVLVPFSQLPQDWGTWRYAYGLNPMAGVVEGVRWSLAHHAMSQPERTRETLSDNRLPERLAADESLRVEVGDDRRPQLVLVREQAKPVGPPWLLLASGLPVTLALLVFGLYYFKRMERQFADIA